MKFITIVFISMLSLTAFATEGSSPDVVQPPCSGNVNGNETNPDKTATSTQTPATQTPATARPAN